MGLGSHLYGVKSVSQGRTTFEATDSSTETLRRRVCFCRAVDPISTGRSTSCRTASGEDATSGCNPETAHRVKLPRVCSPCVAYLVESFQMFPNANRNPRRFFQPDRPLFRLRHRRPLGVLPGGPFFRGSFGRPHRPRRFRRQWRRSRSDRASAWLFHRPRTPGHAAGQRGAASPATRKRRLRRRPLVGRPL